MYRLCLATYDHLSRGRGRTSMGSHTERLPCSTVPENIVSHPPEEAGAIAIPALPARATALEWGPPAGTTEL